MEQQNKDELYMRKALDEARLARERFPLEP